MRKTAGKTAFNSRTVAELGQEVADIMEERVVLEYQLEQLKSIGSQAGADSTQYWFNLIVCYISLFLFVACS